MTTRPSPLLARTLAEMGDDRVAVQRRRVLVDPVRAGPAVPVHLPGSARTIIEGVTKPQLEHGKFWTLS